MLRVYHLGKFAPRENITLYYQYLAFSRSIHVYHTHLYNCLLLIHDCFKWLLKYINNLYNAILLLLGWFLWGTSINAKASPRTIQVYIAWIHNYWQQRLIDKDTGSQIAFVQEVVMHV